MDVQAFYAVTGIHVSAYVIYLPGMFPQAQKEAFSQPEESVEAVSGRKLEVLHLVNDGLTNQEIADLL